MSQHNNGRGRGGPYADDPAASEAQAPDSPELDTNSDQPFDLDEIRDELNLSEAPPAPDGDMISREVHRAALDAETADLRDKLLRAVAETENMRKRMERDVAQARKFAVTEFVKDIIPLTDAFQRAIEAVPEDAAEKDPALKSLMDGVALTERQFLNVMEKHGVKRIEPKGEIFDPNFHQAIAQLPNPDVPAGTIMEVAQAGFVLSSRVIRPAMVVVAQGGPKPGKSANPSTAAENAAPSQPDMKPANDTADPSSEPDDHAPSSPSNNNSATEDGVNTPEDTDKSGQT